MPEDRLEEFARLGADLLGKFKGILYIGDPLKGSFRGGSCKGSLIKGSFKGSFRGSFKGIYGIWFRALV